MGVEGWEGDRLAVQEMGGWQGLAKSLCINLILGLIGCVLSYAIAKGLNKDYAKTPGKNANR